MLRSSPSRLRMERLEQRQLMAGDVAAYLQNGHLYLSEAAGQTGEANYVHISRLDNGQIQVAGLTRPDGQRTLINGADFQSFSVPGNLDVKLGGGSDHLVIDMAPSPFGSGIDHINIDVAGPPTEPTNAPAYAYYRYGFIVQPSPLVVPDQDFVFIRSALIDGSINIGTGYGDDSVHIQNIRAANLTVNTGAGADGVGINNLYGYSLANVNIQTFQSLAETDHDSVTVQSMHAGSLNARLGGGNDWFNVNQVQTWWGDIAVDAGAGDDSGLIYNSTAYDEIMARLGEGNDYLQLSNLNARRMSLLGEGGVDRLYTNSSVRSVEPIVQTGWEYINGFPVWKGQYFNSTLTSSVATKG